MNTSRLYSARSVYMDDRSDTKLKEQIYMLMLMQKHAVFLWPFIEQRVDNWIRDRSSCQCALPGAGGEKSGKTH